MLNDYIEGNNTVGNYPRMKTAAFRFSPACIYLQNCAMGKKLSQVLCLSFPNQ